MRQQALIPFINQFDRSLFCYAIRFVPAKTNKNWIIALRTAYVDYKWLVKVKWAT